MSITDLDSHVASDVSAAHQTVSLDLDAVSADVAIVATSTNSHVAVARSLMERGIAVMVEKPVSDDLAQVDELIAAAQSTGVALGCGMVERHSPILRAASAVLDESPIHLRAIRASPPSTSAHSTVTWDLLIHDLDALEAVFGVRCSVIAASGAGETVDCLLSGTAQVTMTASRSGQRKIRQWEISTPNLLMVADLVAQTLTTYRHQDFAQLTGPGYRAVTVVDQPFIRDRKEPLLAQLDHFIASMREGSWIAELSSVRRSHELAAAVDSLITRRSS